MKALATAALVLWLTASVALAQQPESPYFVTYTDHMEDATDLEIATESTVGLRKQNLPAYWAPLLEFEYGVTDRWTSSLYLEGVTARHDVTAFTGWRFENRFKPLRGSHVINPVLYLEYENINEASRIQKEIVGHAENTPESLSELRQQKAREVEGKLILSSYAKGWNISENFMLEKSLNEDEATEFGYALGISRALKRSSSAQPCAFCLRRFNAGAELYGGLGSSDRFGLKDTAHYLAPTLAWRLGQSSTLKFSPGFGLTSGSDRVLLRFGYSYEVEDFGRKLAHALRSSSEK